MNFVVGAMYVGVSEEVSHGGGVTDTSLSEATVPIRAAVMVGFPIFSA
jgi:hypothetical protein